ncbi:uncharacterized protein EI90DRAFT_3116121 [Cantharellus anzutake]|uniref:uncharacterized protein n=1 Tax=Cantharellus anzutake TaxID=1750568 RepID=UPI0019034DBF|nr:uncharacterized protein EI90DRAFT_3116121 [Cantharellus anzutake]KAF8342182.1 hypothetical protein EI90DRAFT_3116121 [Cantharellus anzutake]
MPSSRIENATYDVHYILFGLLDSSSLKSLSLCSSSLRRATAPQLWRSIRYTSPKARRNSACTINNFATFVQDISGTFIRRLCLDFGTSGLGLEVGNSMIGEGNQNVPFSEELELILGKLTRYARNITHLEVCSHRHGVEHNPVTSTFERNLGFAPHLRVFTANMDRCDARLGKFLRAHPQLHTLRLPLSICEASPLDVYLPSLQSLHVRTPSQSNIIRGQPIKRLSIDYMSTNLQQLELALSTNEDEKARDPLDHLSMGFHGASTAALCAPSTYSDLFRIPALKRLRSVEIKFPTVAAELVNGLAGVVDVLIPALASSLEELAWEGSIAGMDEPKHLDEWVGECFEAGKALQRLSVKSRNSSCLQNWVFLYERQIVQARQPWKMVYSSQDPPFCNCLTR